MSLRVVSLAGELVCEDEPRPGRRSEGVPPGGLYDPETARVLQAWWGVEGPCWELRGGEVEFEATEPIALGWGGAATNQSRDRAILRLGERITLSPRRPGGTLTLVSCTPWQHGPGTRATPGDELQGGGDSPFPPDGNLALLPTADDLVLRYLPREETPVIAGEWGVTIRADRKGVLMNGDQAFDQDHGRSIPVGVGTIQNPGDGQLIIVGPDGPTVGGYPVLGSVIRADRPKVARWAAGDYVTFTAVMMTEAVQAWKDAQSDLAERVRRTAALRKALG